MSRLTLEQKAQLLNHRGKTVVVDGFSIRADQWNQCLHGVKWTEPTTNFPTSIALGATWDTELIHRVATVISDEARAILLMVGNKIPEFVVNTKDCLSLSCH